MVEIFLPSLQGLEVMAVILRSKRGLLKENMSQEEKEDRNLKTTGLGD